MRAQNSWERESQAGFQEEPLLKLRPKGEKAEGCIKARGLLGKAE